MTATVATTVTTREAWAAVRRELPSSSGTSPTRSSPATGATPSPTATTAWTRLTAPRPALEEHGWGGALSAPAGAAGHLHRRHRPGRADHHVPAADRGPARLLAAGELRRPPRPPSTTSAAAASWSTSCRARTTSPRTATPRATRHTATRGPRSSSSSCAGCGPRRTSPTHGEHFRSPTRPWRPPGRPRRPHPPPALLRRRVRGRRAGRRHRGRRPAVLGRAAGRRRANGSSGSGGSARSWAASTPPLEFGLRITTLVRDTTEQAWADAEAKVAEMAGAQDTVRRSNPGADGRRPAAAARPRRPRRGARRQPVHDARASSAAAARARPGWSARPRTWRSRCGSTSLGITHFVLSDTPYLPEIRRQGDQLLPLLRPFRRSAWRRCRRSSPGRRGPGPRGGRSGGPSPPARERRRRRGPRPSPGGRAAA